MQNKDVRKTLNVHEALRGPIWRPSSTMALVCLSVTPSRAQRIVGQRVVGSLQLAPEKGSGRKLTRIRLEMAKIWYVSGCSYPCMGSQSSFANLTLSDILRHGTCAIQIADLRSGLPADLQTVKDLLHSTDVIDSPVPEPWKTLRTLDLAQILLQAL